MFSIGAGNFLVGIAAVIDVVLNLYMWIIIGSAVISWVNPDPMNPIVRFLRGATEPVLYEIRKRLPVSFGGIDFSPFVIILGIIFLQSFLVDSLRMVGRRMGM